ncbi:MAG: NAD(P)-binding domain-containing protein [Acidimicrobiia bacterium]
MPAPETRAEAHVTDVDVAVDVAVVGAGAAGIGVAIALTRRGVAVVVLEGSESIGSMWRRRYEGLRLNTLRQMSALPAERIARTEGRWVTKEAFVAHLEDAARRHRLDIRLGTRVTRVDADGNGGYCLATTRGDLRAVAVVVATGDDRVPNMPAWAGQENFGGTLLHAADYTSAAPYRGQDVLVVGVGNSGTEIATQLAAGGARRVRVAHRRPVNILPVSFAGVPITALARISEALPAAVVDRLAFVVQRLAWGDLSPYGMGRAARGAASEVKSGNTVVVLDRGFVAALRSGSVELVGDVAAFDGPDVVLSGGARIRPDVVVAATGYRRGLEELVGHLGVLAPDGKPSVFGGRTHPDAPGLYFNGYWLPYSGHLPGMRRTSRRIAGAIARQPRRRRRRGPVLGHRDVHSTEILDGNEEAFERLRPAGSALTMADAQRIVVDTIEAMERRTLAHVVMADFILRLARERAGDARPIRILEVASGNGWLLTNLWRRARRSGIDVELTGSDLNDGLVVSLRERLAKAGVPAGVSVIDARRITGVPDGAYHLAVMTFTLHHLQGGDLTAALAELDRVAGGGMVNVDIRRGLMALAVVPNLATLVGPTGGRRFARHDATVTVRRSYTTDELREVVAAAGLAHPYEVGPLPTRHPERLVAHAIWPASP